MYRYCNTQQLDSLLLLLYCMTCFILMTSIEYNDKVEISGTA